MTWIKTSDPLALLAIQAGQTPNPTKQVGAIASNSLDVDQRSIDIGEPVPIVFARRRNDAGGILISPGATEARFENDTSNNVTVYYHLVLSEGQIDSIPVKDVLQRSCRVGSHTQTYNRRAGTWLPGNNIIEQVGFDKPEASYICGSIGLYPDMSTLSFEVTVPNGFDYWRRQVHVFIRGGMYVTRLLDSVFGPSDNFADLVQWMLANNGRVPTALIDTTALTEAAQFLDANGFTCNCWMQEARNYSDLLTEWAPYFLLGESNINGKKGLRPILPANNDGTIKITSITPEYTFTDSEILTGSLEIDYTSWADRQPFVAQMIWRQELGNDAAIIRTAEVQLSSNTSETGPYESHDLSAFCTSETHAVKAGAYILARRVYVSHTIRFSARPQVHSTILSPGSIIRVALERKASGGSYSAHDYFYQVERITKTMAGDVSYECSHFPVDTEQRSIVAQLVAAATGTGILLTSNSSGVGCDINSSTDETIPPEEYIVPDDAYDPGGLDIGTDVATDAGEPTLLNTGGLNDAGSGAALGTGGGFTENNPLDNYDTNNPLPLQGLLGNGNSLVTNPLATISPCELQWYKDGVAIPGAVGSTYTPAPQDLGSQISAIDNCGGNSNGAQVVGYDPKFSQNGGVKANVTFRRIIQTYWKLDCSTGVVQPYVEDTSTTLYLEFKEIKTYTAYLGGSPGLPNSMSYKISCNAGTGTNYRINGGYQILTSDGSYINTGLWGSNITLSANQALDSFHSTIITSIVLTEANAAYGNVGDNVLDLGILEAISSGASFWTKGTVIT